MVSREPHRLTHLSVVAEPDPPAVVTAKTPLDRVHDAAAKLTADSSPSDLLAVLDQYRKACYPEGGPWHPGTLAWYMADFFPRWVEANGARAATLAEDRTILLAGIAGALAGLEHARAMERPATRFGGAEGALRGALAGLNARRLVAPRHVEDVDRVAVLGRDRDEARDAQKRQP